MLVRRRRRARRTGEGLLGVEVGSSILLEGLELVIGEVVEDLLSNDCVSLLVHLQPGAKGGLQSAEQMIGKVLSR